MYTTIILAYDLLLLTSPKKDKLVEYPGALRTTFLTYITSKFILLFYLNRLAISIYCLDDATNV